MFSLVNPCFLMPPKSKSANKKGSESCGGNSKKNDKNDAEREGEKQVKGGTSVKVKNMNLIISNN